MAQAGSVVPPLADRPMKNTVVLFDVDNTLALPRQVSCSIDADLFGLN
jgi:phosphomannomutase